MREMITRNNRGRLAALLLVRTLRTFGTVGVAVLLNILIDAVFAALTSGKTDRLLWCAAFCCVYALFFGAVIYADERWKASAVSHSMRSVRGCVMEGILGKELPEFQAENSARYLALLGQNLSTFEENYLKNLLSIYDSIVSMAAAAAMLIWIDPLIAGISIAAMSIPSLIPKLFAKKLSARQKKAAESTTAYQAVVKDILGGFEVVKSYRIAAVMQEKSEKAAAEMEGDKAGIAAAMAAVYGLANTASVAVQFLLMALCGVFAVHGMITIGSVVAVTQLTGQVISPAFQLSAKYSMLHSVRPICEQIREAAKPRSAEASGQHEAAGPCEAAGKQRSLRSAAKPRSAEASGQHEAAGPCEAAGKQRSLRSAAKPPVCADRPEAAEMKRSLALRDVSFSYGGAPVLKRVSLSLEYGKKYALVGKSGCGKSTLLRLIAGYDQRSAGSMTVDGHEERACALSLISQNIFLFDDTIRNNMTLYGDYTPEEIQAAVRLAGLEGLIASLENGIDTEVLENGRRFSGGEKQRIAIARALLHKRSLLLLDEATSALDEENAGKIERAILGLKDITCLSVTHRLSSGTLREQDGIFVMEDGEIVEQGTYAELMQKNGSFRRLHDACSSPAAG